MSQKSDAPQSTVRENGQHLANSERFDTEIEKINLFIKTHLVALCWEKVTFTNHNQQELPENALILEVSSRLAAISDPRYAVTTALRMIADEAVRQMAHR